MSIFESLCNEPDDNKRRESLLSIVQPYVRDKISPILSDTNTTTDITPGWPAWIVQIVYRNKHWKIILTPIGIDRVDEFGTTWNISSPTKKEHSGGLYKS